MPSVCIQMSQMLSQMSEFPFFKDPNNIPVFVSVSMCVWYFLYIFKIIFVYFPHIS